VCVLVLELQYVYPHVNMLRVPVHKYGKELGKGQKFDFAHIFAVDGLRRGRDCWMVFLARYPFISGRCAGCQIPLRSSFDAPFC